MISPVFIIGSVMGTYPLISPITAPFSRSGRHFSPYSGKISTIVSGIPRFSARSVIGALLQMEITANSTYRKADLRFYGQESVEWGNDGFWGSGFLGSVQGDTFGYDQISPF